ncbi:MAG: DUF6478 family protein [Ruegeria sp.]
MGRLLDRYFNRAVLNRWRRAARQAEHASLPILRLQRDQARHLRTQLDKLIQVADSRLIRPLIGSRQFPKPLGTDWSWRPDLWRGPLPVPGYASIQRKTQLDGQIAVFHDCPLAEIGTRQIRNTREKDLAPFGLSLDVFSFQGSFLSVSVELPPDATRDLTRQHMMRASITIDSERQAEVFARLNIQHGPNTEQVLRKLETTKGFPVVDFDLAHLNLNERRIEKMWLDVIFEHPDMNRIVLRDVTLCRHHRADM